MVRVTSSEVEKMSMLVQAPQTQSHSKRLQSCDEICRRQSSLGWITIELGAVDYRVPVFSPNRSTNQKGSRTFHAN